MSEASCLKNYTLSFFPRHRWYVGDVWCELEARSDGGTKFDNSQGHCLKWERDRVYKWCLESATIGTEKLHVWVNSQTLAQMRRVSYLSNGKWAPRGRAHFPLDRKLASPQPVKPTNCLCGCQYNMEICERPPIENEISLIGTHFGQMQWRK